MGRCDEIKAHIRMEERYQGLSLVFADNREIKDEILKVIVIVKNQTGQTPFIFEKISKDSADLQAVCIEFRDDIHREGGDFLTKVLQKLQIEKCEKDI